MKEIKELRNNLSEDEVKEHLLELAFTMVKRKSPSVKLQFPYKDRALSVACSVGVE